MTIGKETGIENTNNRKCGHIKPRAPMISLEQDGRLRVSNLMAILGVSHSTLYDGLRSGRYPKPDGYDGKIPYWRTRSIKQFLEAGTVGGAS